MRIIYFLFFSFVLHLLYSCSEQKEPDRLHELLDKLENEGDSESTLDDLLELTEEMEGTATIIVDSAHFEITFPITNPEESTIIQIIENERIKIYQYKANTQDSEDDNLGYSIDYVFIPELKTEEEIDYLFNERNPNMIFFWTNPESRYSTAGDRMPVTGHDIIEKHRPPSGRRRPPDT